MGIVLLVLKVIGIILLCILGLILLLLLLTLFSPLTYNVVASGSMESYKVKAKIGWFLNIFRVNACFKDGKLKLRLRIFGIPFNLGAKSEKKQKREETLPAQLPETAEVVGTAEVVEAAEVSETVEAEVTEVPETTEEILLIEEKTTDIDPEREAFEEPENKPSIKDKIKNIFKREKKPKLSEEEKQRLKEEKARLKAEKKEAAKRAREEKIKQIKEYISKGKEIWAYLQEDETKKAISLAKDVLKKVLKHILPRKFKGHVDFGLEDPSTTGTVVAAVCAAYPVHKGNMIVTPYFDTDEMILKGKAQVKGHIILCYLAIQGLRILTNKRIMSLIKKARNK